MRTFIKSLTHATRGIGYCIIRHKNFQLQILAGIIALGASAYFNITRGEWIAIIFCCSLVLILEMINTSIEELANVVSPSYLPAIKIVKDVSAGAVLLAAITALIIGIIIFLPYVKHILHV